MENQLVSVVIPAYNAQNYISECLNATVLQSYEKLEIIIVDDGSTDKTAEICQVYANKDKRIKVIKNKENAGVSTSRNRGMRTATGEYVVFFDADDFPEIDLIESFLKAIEEWKDKNVSMILCGMYQDNVVNSRVSNKISLLEENYGYIEGENYKLTRSVAATLSWLRLFNFVTNKVYNLNVIRSNNIIFDEQMHIGEDLKFNLDYLDATTGSIGMINRPLYHYVKRTNSSLSISYYDNGIDDTKYIYKRFIAWEEAQPEATPDNVLVLKAIFITDWTARLTALYDESKTTPGWVVTKRKLEKEIQSKEFQKMLKEVHSAGKISRLRYMALRTGIFGVFHFMRGVYQIMKG